MKDIWRIESNSKWLNPFGKIKTPVQWKGRTKMCYVIKKQWNHKWSWVICERLLLGFFARIYFLPRHRWASRQPGWFSFYIILHIYIMRLEHWQPWPVATALVLTFAYISLCEKYLKYRFEDGKWRSLSRLMCGTVSTQQNLHLCYNKMRLS